MEKIELSYDGPLATVSFLTNEKNILTQSALKKLHMLFGELKQSSAKVCLLKSANQEFFSNGLDPLLFLDTDKETIKENTRLIFETAGEFFFLPQITICVINGHCMGAASVFAIYADYRYMNQSRGRIGFPEINIAMSFPAFAYEVLRELVGERESRDLLLSGKLIKAQEALKIGLIDDIAHEEILYDLAYKKALEFCQRPKESLRAIKEARRRKWKKMAFDLTEEDVRIMVETIMSANTQEGFRSLWEGRRARFAEL
ncbi:MAG: enoyl-CoA hydratase/isomerase family protein [Leptospiraceae bacterium]|nr:enoyl-CoA hydratase/isomerase family protein [Leptospiraceae bacterium]MDW8306011.1 enoyl-CoA hydratase/isomerase family protein [Leptospiraceae bacterium]